MNSHKRFSKQEVLVANMTLSERDLHAEYSQYDTAP